MKLKYLILLAVSGTIISIDQLTKQIVVQRFLLGESVEVISGFFNLTYVHNPGAAFGFLAQAHSGFRVPFFIVVPMIALAIIGFIFRKVDDRDLKLSGALSLVIGGAVGNLIDRVAYNYVIDFLDFHWNYAIHFPAFNVADIAITVGVAILIIDIFQKESAQAKNVSNAA
ncbi:MAG TPA: signal peptidase II [Oligoflexia bacterium]|nr:signal peptidase II [Oligoflexia bacterium]